jgi:UrcA family protein
MLKYLLLMSCLCFPVAAHAEEDGDQVSVSVRYADLDLTQEPGQRRLEARVRAAVAMACGNGDEFSLKGKLAKRRCVSVASRSSAQQVAAALSRANDRMHLAAK